LFAAEIYSTPPTHQFAASMQEQYIRKIQEI
jgi:hypothetical protein